MVLAVVGNKGFLLRFVSRDFVFFLKSGGSWVREEKMRERVKGLEIDSVVGSVLLWMLYF